ncbi:signal peptidase II [Acidipropionibacterium jensenii]|uniref:signal peptidase II n=1 Tax=Acidipropionibacterium jensenii TaxID=1749 RepID=UPI000BC2E2D9|nr:signal peptidase II [Acidipropionibacterium jensenii]AZZ43273.1 signal peptidase [Acidipropionibacterium jensenii]MDN5976552.1 signal peptidase II [Acidipropionibacterium jensenii]MDN5996989.1 signal peptidase II [Acidipropionibacterium jensenii]MDN6020991.1 signal peptidase II [Acidipropionibacterium jensenii]MDN6427493.1 signal peptidase II [Acidipropionibacterium jensenii]
MVLIAVCGLALDQIVKAVAVANLDPADPPVLFGGLLRLQLLRNPGAAFSMGSSATVVISVFATIALGVVIGYGAPRCRHRWTLVACGMVMAGIAGNLTDRLFRAPGVLRGHVVDLFALPHFAVFNVADMFITATAVLVVAAMAFGGRGER